MINAYLLRHKCQLASPTAVIVLASIVVEKTYIPIPLPQSLTLPPPAMDMTSGRTVQMPATPTIAAITSLARSCGTSLNTMIVESRPNAITIVGVSRALLLP